MRIRLTQNVRDEFKSFIETELKKIDFKLDEEESRLVSILKDFITSETIEAEEIEGGAKIKFPLELQPFMNEDSTISAEHYTAIRSEVFEEYKNKIKEL